MATAKKKKTAGKKQTTRKKTTNNKSKTPKKKQTSNKKSFKRIYEIELVALIATFIIWVLSMHTSSTGIVGEAIRHGTLGLLGGAGYITPYVFISIIFLLINPNMKAYKTRYLIAFILFYFSALIFMGLLALDEMVEMFDQQGLYLYSFLGIQESYQAGINGLGAGVIGNFLTYFFFKMIGRAGLFIVMILGLSVAGILFTNFKVQEFFTDRRKKAILSAMKSSLPSLEGKEDLPQDAIAPVQKETPKPVKATQTKQDKEITIKNFDGSVGPKADEAAPKERETQIERDEPKIKTLKELKKEQMPTVLEQESVEAEIEKSVASKSLEYNKPRLEYLDKGNVDMKGQIEDRQAMLEKAELLEATLRNFGVDAKVVEISRGPTITRYEIQPKPGTKVSKIVGLSDDIALNLAATHVRIAPVPGKVAVGIEIPNEENSMVRLRDIIESGNFKKSKSKLQMALGKDISGQPIIADLSKMPHLLIAGATGSGKSVCVNTIIASILYNASPEEVKLLMIDPKVVELNVYNGIPHLILPVVTDPKKASIALGWAVNEMTKRYELFAEAGVKDVDGYNKKFKEERMPKIVVIIDELADLMMVAPNQVEDAIARLAQMARAAGIHLIVATQRPSVDVITGLIKANIPSRIAFSVSSQVDSRTILDMAGAEKLLGRGDMLFNPVGAPKPRRVQGAFISEEEIEKIVDHIKGQVGEVTYQEEILEQQGTFGGDFDADELLEEAVRLVVQMQSASASMLQRKFRVGYNRAARLIDQMEELGVVGPSQGSKAREVIVDEIALEEMEL